MQGTVFDSIIKSDKVNTFSFNKWCEKLKKNPAALLNWEEICWKYNNSILMTAPNEKHFELQHLICAK